MEKQLRFVPQPVKSEFSDGILKGVPYFSAEGYENPIYSAIQDELSEKGDIKVEFKEALTDEFSTANEGYKLVIGKNGITVFACSPAGHLYGALTLVKIVNQFGKELPIVTVYDKPASAFRAGAMESLHGMRYKEDWAKRWVRKLAYGRANHLYIGYDMISLLPEYEQYGFGEFNAKSARELAAYAKKYNISIIPSVSVQGHYNEILSLQKYSGMREVMEEEETEVSNIGNAICPNNPVAVKFICRLIDITVDIFKPDILMIGGDEIYSSGGDKACRHQMKNLGKTGIILSNFIRFRDYIEAKGIKMGVWGDMIIAISGENRYDGSLESDKFRQSNMYLLDMLKRNTIVFDWWYVGESERSQKFFSENGFEVIACTSTHACMMHFASPQQQINMWSLFKGIEKYNLHGGMITDWINMFGYQTEQTLFNQYAGLTMLWRGCDSNFIKGQSREQFEKDFFVAEYGAKDESLREYFHLAGDLYGDLLSMFSVKNRGVALRKAFFYEDNPLNFFLKFSVDLWDSYPRYGKLVEKLEDLWEKAKKSCTVDEYFECLHMPALLNRYLYTEYTVMNDMYAHYKAAAEAQFDDKQTFKKELDECKKIVSSLSGKTKDLYDFTMYLQEKVGVFDLSEFRMKGREKNIEKLVRYFEYLKKDAYPIPVLKLISENLFHTPLDNWWKERCFNTIMQDGEFSVYDIDRGQFYESMDWGIPTNK